MFVPLNDYFSFHLRACDNAYVRLSSTSLYASDYELEIKGDTTKLIDLTSGTPVEGASVETPGMLACYGSKEFWLTWHDAALRVSARQCVDACSDRL